MPNQVNKFLTQDVDQLLEDNEFRNWVLRSDALYPDSAVNIREAHTILSGLKYDDGLALPTEGQKDADFDSLMIMVRTTSEAPVRRVWPVFLAVAAAVLLLIAGGIFLLHEPAPGMFATGNAEQLDINLPDGTSVTLNANSTLQLPGGGWGADARRVSLDGEAYFDVVKDRDRPFLVNTDDATIRVLGTRFNVRERRGSTRVFLEEGEVEIGWPGTELPETRMLPNDVVILAERGMQPLHKPAGRPGRHLAWRSGHLEFDRLPLAEALNELSDIYGIELKCANSALEKLEISSAGIPVGDRTLALRLMEEALGLRIEAQKNNVYLVSATE